MPKHTQPTLPADAELVLPEQVTVALAGLADAAREGLLALAVGTGLGMLGSLLEADVERLVGPRAATTRSGPRSVTAPSPARSPWAAAACGSTGHACAASMVPPSWPCRPGRRSPPPSCWTSWRWSGCWPAVDPPRSGRARAGRQPCRPGDDRDLQVSDLAPVRRRDRAGPGRAAGRRPVHPRPGRALGRRDRGRRALLCGRAGDHPGRHQDPARAGRDAHRHPAGRATHLPEPSGRRTRSSPCSPAAATMPPTSSAARTARWCCAGSPPAWARRPLRSAASTAPCTDPHCGPPSTRPSLLSHRPRRMPPPDHRWTATQIPRWTGHPRAWCRSSNIRPL